MRRAVLLASVACLGATGVALAAVPLTDVYVVKGKITPAKSGTRNHPSPISSSLGWDASSAPPGQRPANVQGYKIYFEGIRENTTLFAGCDTSRLSTPHATPSSCPKDSQIGSGFLIFELGGSGQSNAAYDGTCTASLAVFNGGYHNLTLFVYQGPPLPDQPTECTIPGNHEAINVNIAQSGRGITETFSVPAQLLHPVPGLDTAVTHGLIQVQAKQKVVNERLAGQNGRRRRGLFESFFCPPNHPRQVAMTFTREDGVGRTRTTLVPCQ